MTTDGQTPYQPAPEEVEFVVTLSGKRYVMRIPKDRLDDMALKAAAQALLNAAARAGQSEK